MGTCRITSTSASWGCDMKLKVSKAVLPHDRDELHLEPDNDADRVELEKLLKFFRVNGFGREPHSGRIMHMQIPLERNDNK